MFKHKFYIIYVILRKTIRLYKTIFDKIFYFIRIDDIMIVVTIRIGNNIKDELKCEL
ncbi:hypothetical protein CPJCM30710_28400 [Clostridium polyendosporum]|uniref:Uncharacterized protein n=1 Tax=Clostridium polyendosporum TaxID=69208 RepID=A0A919S1K6_9CLOT|nr:hypothetical protein CPJCM30710_28400 [Clostridium polyendosporum]